MVDGDGFANVKRKIYDCRGIQAISFVLHDANYSSILHNRRRLVLPMIGKEMIDFVEYRRFSVGLLRSEDTR